MAKKTDLSALEWKSGFTSSNVEAYAYNWDQALLYVRFHGSRTYEYSGVPLAIADGLDAAASKGQYVYNFVRNRFSFRKV